MRHRPGWGWLLLALAVCAIAALTLVGAMVERASSAEMVRLKPGELDLLARMAYSEARSDGAPGMAAVVHVALNRLEDPRFGKTLGAILKAPAQFAVGPARNETDPDWLLALWVAAGAVLGKIPDQTGGAQYFHLASMKRPPKWARDFILTAKVGSHLFFRPVVN